jgi:hypothetical protein
MAVIHPSRRFDFTDKTISASPAHDIRDTASSFGLASIAGADIHTVAAALGRASGKPVTLPHDVPAGMLNDKFANNSNS